MRKGVLYELGALLAVVLVLGMVGLVIAMGVDYAISRPVPVRGATVVEKVYEPAHDSTGIVLVTDGSGGTTIVPTFEHVPERWALLVSLGDRTLSVPCSSTQWGSVEKGGGVDLERLDGRLWSHGYRVRE